MNGTVSTSTYTPPNSRDKKHRGWIHVLPGTHTAVLNVTVITTCKGAVAMNLQNEDIGAGIFLWAIVSFFTMGLTVLSTWIILS